MDPYDKEFIEDLIGRLPQIDACEFCQPREEGEVVWVEGEPQSVSEFLEDNQVPEAAHELFAKRLTCSQCGCELELDFEIIIDSFHSKLDENAGERFAQWVVEETPRLNGFVDFLLQSPEEGTTHELGRELLNQIQDLPTRIISGDWWRSQSINKTDPEPSISRMGPPPQSLIVEGRFNRSERRVFYLGSNRISAIQEALKYRQPEEDVWVQCFNITDADKILDLRASQHWISDFHQIELPILFAGLLWCNGLVQQAIRSEQAKEYVLPQFIAECASSIEINGICFNSQLHEGNNLVLFKWNEHIVSPKGNPELQRR